MDKNNSAGFTLFEIIIVIAILSILATMVVFDFVSSKKNSDLDNSVKEFVSVLTLAQNKTISSEDYKQYGVYLNTGVSPNQYILFKGTSYALRDDSADVIYFLQNTAEFYNVNFNGGNEVVFSRLTGATEESGSVSIRIKTDAARNKTVYMASSGLVSLDLPATPPDSNRVIDARHVYFNYGRIINVATESITLTFGGTITKTFLISDNLSAGELKWQDTFDIGGASQTIVINTQNLDSSNVSFNIYRDRRYNDKSLKITISGDGSGSLAEYPADGTDANFLSSFISGFKKI